MVEYNNVRALQIELWQNCNNNCSFCVGKGSQVLLPDYSERSIEDIKVGDIILTYNTKLHKYEEATVLNTSVRHIIDKVYKLMVGDRRLHITPNHKISVKYKTYKWMTPEQIIKFGNKVKICAPGMNVANPKDEYVDNYTIELMDLEGHVYNLETTSGTYIANGVLVHNCYLSNNRINSDSSDKEKSILQTQKILDTLDNKFNAVGLIGGEFFQGQLSTLELREMFRDLIKRLDTMLDSRLEQVWVTASLMSNDLGDFLYCFDGIKNKDKFLICTSYDTVGRFKSSKEKELWFHNVETLHDMGFVLHTQTITTTCFIEEALTTDILDRISSISMFDFKTPTVFRNSYLELCKNGSTTSYRQLVLNSASNFGGGFFISDRNSFLKFLIKIKKLFGDEKLRAFCSNKVRSDEVCILSQGITISNRWGEHGIENAPCGHPWDSYCYKNSDKCARCDALALLDD